MAHLSGFGLENFRVFKDYTWFDFAPITLFVGPNSSGKSSVIKALLLLQDNYKKKFIPYSEIKWLSGYGDLIDFSGKNHNLQNDKSIIPYGGGKDIKFSLPYEEFGPYNPLRQHLFWESSYQIYEQGLEPGIVTKLRTEAEDLFISDCGEKYAFLDTLLLKNILRNKRSELKNSSTANRDRNISNLNTIFAHEVSPMLWPDFDRLKNELKTVNLGKVKINWDESSWWNENSEIVQRLLQEMSVEKAGILSGLINSILKLDSLSPAFWSWARFVYVPSIKGLPKRYLRFDDDSELLNKLFIHLKDSREQEHDTINRFVRKWETEFGFKAPILWNKDDELGLTKIQIGSDYLSDLGFGISQLVATLLSNYAFTPNDDPHLIMLEEPESNLHPAFQSKLADMFVDSEKTLGHQFIIETHSEYLIRKFQYLTAKGEMKPEDIVIYYFHDPNNIPAGEKQVKKITILEDGSLSDDFGPGFYDEAAHWELELLKLKRNKGRQN